MSDEDDIARGIHAQQIIDDPLVAGAFVAIEETCIKQWREAPTAETREDMWLLLQNLDTFRGLFAAYIRSGQVALAKGERKAEAKKQDAALDGG